MVSFWRIANDASITHEKNNKLKFKSIRTPFVQETRKKTKHSLCFLPIGWLILAGKDVVNVGSNIFAQFFPWFGEFCTNYSFRGCIQDAVQFFNGVADNAEFDGIIDFVWFFKCLIWRTFFLNFAYNFQQNGWLCSTNQTEVFAEKSINGSSFFNIAPASQN